MKFPYIQILKQAYGIVTTHKVLWAFGLFLVWGYLPNLIYLYDKPVPWEKVPPAVAVGGAVAVVVLALIYFRARAGLILASKFVIDKQPVSFKKAWQAGGATYARMFAVSMLLQLGLAGIFMLLALPVAYLAAGDSGSRAAVLGLLALLIFLPLWFIGTMTNIVAQVLIGVYNMRLGGAMASALDLVSKCWRQLFVIGFFTFSFSVIGGLLSVFPAGLVTLLVEILGQLAYHKGSPLPDNYNLIALAVSGLVFFLVQAVISVFHQAAWVLTVLELTKPQKTEEAGLAEAPEVVL